MQIHSHDDVNKEGKLFFFTVINFNLYCYKDKDDKKKCRTYLSQAPNDTNNKMCTSYFIFIVSSIMFSNQMVKVSEPNALFELGSSGNNSQAHSQLQS